MSRPEPVSLTPWTVAGAIVGVCVPIVFCAGFGPERTQVNHMEPPCEVFAALLAIPALVGGGAIGAVAGVIYAGTRRRR